MSLYFNHMNLLHFSHACTGRKEFNAVTVEWEETT
jgi:hypothetical protein